MRKIAWQALALVCAAGWAFAQQKDDHVDVEYDAATDFSRYQTYAWAPFQDPAPNPANHVRITRAVERELEAKGLVKVEREAADLLVRYQGRFEKKLRGTPSQSPSAWQPSSPRFIVNFAKVDVGTLVLELWDARRKDVVWHAKGSQVMARLDRVPEQIDAGVTRLLSEYPPPAGEDKP